MGKPLAPGLYLTTVTYYVPVLLTGEEEEAISAEELGEECVEIIKDMKLKPQYSSPLFVDRLRDVPKSLRDKKPFAIEVELEAGFPEIKDLDGLN